MALCGLVTGSFLEALTYRLPKNIPIYPGRSYCPHCKHEIKAYDNIPVLSYLILQGKCRDCKKRIPVRSLLLEVSLALLFPLIYVFHDLLIANTHLINVPPLVSLIILLITLTISVAIFVIDVEHQIIPDSLSLGLFVFAFATILLFSTDPFIRLLVGFGMATFLLLLHILTKGKGMGLGDVKLVLGQGMLLGFPGGITMMFLSFFSGAVIGIIVLMLGVKSLKSRIAFGPFLIIGFWLILFFDRILETILLPFI